MNPFKSYILLCVSFCSQDTEPSEQIPNNHTKVGVICMYKPQVWTIKRALESCGWVELFSFGANISISTVDAFQGQELDIAIIATTRNYNTEFLNNPNRINVAITRARHHVLLVGDSNVLNRSTILSRICQAAKRRKRSVPALLADEPNVFSLWI